MAKGKKPKTPKTPAPPPGRPTKCTRAFISQLALLLAGGAHPNAAVAALGVSDDSRRRWIERGTSNPTTIYGEFCGILSQQHAFARVTVATKLHAQALQGDTAAANSWLRHVKAEGFEPQNTFGIFNADEHDSDDTEALRATLAEKVARHADAERKG